jgi:hypothetical protein
LSPLFEITDSGFRSRDSASFADLQIRERQDLQQLLREDISAIDPDLLVIAEEYGQWQDARRRVDLLAVDKEARLVVIELKRTDDGGHMELQAIRYAAMLSAMGVDEAVAAYSAFLARLHPDEERDARRELADFVEQEEDALELSTKIRIVLVSGDFGREITTTVLWLNEFEPMDIRCFRLVPYEIGETVVVDVQQVIPLPEAAEYQVRLRRKDQERRRARSDGRDFTRFQIVVDGTPQPDENKRRAVCTMVETLVGRGCDPAAIAAVIGPRKFRGIDGTYSEPREMVEPMEAAYPEFRFDPGRFWTERPIHHAGRTWVISKMWGRDTQGVLQDLTAAFPRSGIGFQRADD